MEKYFVVFLLTIGMVISTNPVLPIEAASISPYVACWTNPDETYECGSRGPNYSVLVYTKLTIFSMPIELLNGDTIFQGHTFLLIENYKNVEIKFLTVPIPAHSAISIGLWGDGGTERKGVLINREIDESISYPSRFDTMTSISDYITLTEFRSLESFTLNNDVYSFFEFNCSWFASTIWNQLTPYDVIAGETPNPTSVFDSIKSYSTSETNRQLYGSRIVYYLHNSAIYLA